MYETLRMCQQMTPDNIRAMTEAQVLALADESVKVAEFYRRNFGLIKRAADKYFSISGQDKASIILLTIARSIQNYISVENGGSSFATYMMRAIQNALKDEFRKVLREHELGHVESIDEMKESNYEPSVEEDFFGNLETEFDLSGLNEQQKKLCFIIMRDNKIPTNVEIAEELGVSSMRVTYIKRAIAEKLAPQFSLLSR